MQSRATCLTNVQLSLYLHILALLYSWIKNPHRFLHSRENMSISFSSSFSLKEELALVTGGGSGLGLSIAQCLADAGARVIITGRRRSVLEKAVKEIGKNVAFISCDVNDLNSLPGLIR